MNCEKCHKVLEVGDWPWCPHAKGESAAISDDIPGGLVMEHVEPGRKVYSKSELKRVLKEKGWQLRERHVDNGRMKDKHLSRWI